MNIVFVAPPKKKSRLPKEYTAIINLYKKAKHRLYSEYVIETPSKLDIQEHLQKRHKKVVAEIHEADLVIVEASALTPELSRFISIALQQHVPTLVLYKGTSPEVYVFESSRLLSLKKYTSSTLTEVIQTYLKQVVRKRLIYRFNLMLSKELGGYVMDRAQESGVSKADYIRKLIVKDMDSS